jgi:hypothetical protein
MARPRKDQNIRGEKELTFLICSHLKKASGLDFRALEERFAMGAKHPIDGRPTGRTFQRYCDEVLEKRHAASRDRLYDIVKISLQEGWIDTQFASEWSKWLGQPDGPRPSEIASRRREVVGGLLTARARAVEALENLWQQLNLTEVGEIEIHLHPDDSDGVLTPSEFEYLWCRDIHVDKPLHPQPELAKCVAYLARMNFAIRHGEVRIGAFAKSKAKAEKSVEPAIINDQDIEKLMAEVMQLCTENTVKQG